MEEFFEINSIEEISSATKWKVSQVLIRGILLAATVKRSEKHQKKLR